MDDDDDDALAEKIAALRALHASDKKGNELAAQLMSDMPAPPPKEVLKAVKPRPPRKEADMTRLESLPRREPPAKDAGTPRGNETLSRRDALAKALEATWLESADEKEARLLKAAQGTLAAPKAAHDDESNPSVQRARRRESSASRCAARPADDEATEREKAIVKKITKGRACAVFPTPAPPECPISPLTHPACLTLSGCPRSQGRQGRTCQRQEGQGDGARDRDRQ